MRKFYKLIALMTALTMLFSTAVMASCSPTSSQTTKKHKSSDTDVYNPNWGRAIEGVPSTANTVAQEALALAPAYTAGVASLTAGVNVAPVNLATVNYATLGAKILVSPTAVVYKSLILDGNAKNVAIAVPGVTKGQKVAVLAYDMSTATWKKINCKVADGQVSFNKGADLIFSVVVDVVAP